MKAVDEIAVAEVCPSVLTWDEGVCAVVNSSEANFSEIVVEVVLAEKLDQSCVTNAVEIGAEVVSESVVLVSGVTGLSLFPT